MDECCVKDRYFGEKHRQLRNGYGVYCYDNKFFHYEGEWLNGKKHGHGKFSMRDGSYYEGEFCNGEICGHGFRYFALNQNTYSGEFVAGEMHGQGVMTYADGSTYEGEWQNNKHEGFGIMRSADGWVYQGMYHDNKRHGQGATNFRNVEFYDGDWVCDRRQGHGEWKGENGAVYVGQWQNDLYNGHGILNHISGAMYEGLWANGLPVCLAVKLEITGVENPLNISAGQSFSIFVECHTVDGEVMEDCGREIEVIAGIRYIPSKTSKDSLKLSTASALIDKRSSKLTDEKSKTSELIDGKSSTKLIDQNSKSSALVDETSKSQLTDEKSKTSGLVDEKSSSKLIDEKSKSSALPDGTSKSQLTDEKSKTCGLDDEKSLSPGLTDEAEEDAGCQLVMTPLGFEIVPYPLWIMHCSTDETVCPEVPCNSKSATVEQQTEKDTIASDQVVSGSAAKLNKPVTDDAKKILSSNIVQVDKSRKISVSGSTKQVKRSSKAGANELSSSKLLISATSVGHSTNEVKRLSEAATNELGSSKLLISGSSVGRADELGSCVFVPVSTIRTVAGRVVFNDLVLPSVSPLQAPVNIQTDSSVSPLQAPVNTQRDSSVSPLQAPVDKRKDSSVSPLQAPADKWKNSSTRGDESNAEVVPQVIVADDKPSVSQQQCNIFASPGEYIILVRDVTEPAVLDFRLESATLIVNICDEKSSNAQKSNSQLSLKKSVSKTSVS